MYIVNVAVDIKTNLIKKSYSYSVSDDDFKKLKLFSCVKVQFNNQIKIGFIVELNVKCDYEVKQILQIVVIDTINDYQKKLLEKMIIFYKVDYINLIDLFITQKIRNILKQGGTYENIIVRKQILYHLNSEKKLTEKQKNAIIFFSENKAFRQKLLDNNISISVLNTMEKNEIITREYVNYNYEIPYKNYIKKKVVLTALQKQVADEICSQKKISLLHGVTSSGKTEIYLELIRKKIKQNFQSALIVPENTLSYLFSSRLENEFGNIVGILYENMSENAIYDVYQKIKNGVIKVVVGSKKVIFLPFKNLKFIIVDEEHSFKHQNNQFPYYKLSEIVEFIDAKILLASATPSITSYAKAQKSLYDLVVLDKRYNNIDLPIIEVIEQKDKEILFALDILEIIKRNIENNKKVLIYHNRLGYNTQIQCNKCAHTFVCPHCSTGIIYDKFKNRGVCNYCNYILLIKTCPICKNNDITKSGYGIDKVFEYIEKIFKTDIVLIDRKSISKKRYLKYVLDKIAENNGLIIVGTNTCVSGLDIGDLDLVVTTNIDNQLFYPNFKSREILFQNLVQLAGRTGRMSSEGHMIIQTSKKDSIQVNNIVSQDYKVFYELEMKMRKQTKLPPYYNICQILIYNKDINYLTINQKTVVKKILNLGYEVYVKKPYRYKIREQYYLLINIKYKKEDIKNDLTKIIKGLKNNRINYKIDYKISDDIFT